MPQELYPLIEAEMMSLADKRQACHLMRFFKTGPGEYGYGDRFLGIKVPLTRKLCDKYRRQVTLHDVKALVMSPWHEIRLLGFLCLVEIYESAKRRRIQFEPLTVVDFYLEHLGRGNNWDLVDLVAPKILGDWIVDNPGQETMLYELAAREDSLWHQRVAIVATLALINKGKFGATFKLAQRFVKHPHDLIHKATGWMLREVGKKGGRIELIEFIDSHGHEMPRTMLRYAIEKFPEEQRKRILATTRRAHNSAINQ